MILCCFTLETRKVCSQNIVGLKGHAHTLRKIIWVPVDRYLDFLPLTLQVQGWSKQCDVASRNNANKQFKHP